MGKNTGLPRRVLIVDDSRAILAIVRRVVLEAGGAQVEVRSATSAEEALDMVNEFAPDLVITDWHMPGVTGIEMLQTLRQTGHADVRVGFVTAETTPERVAEAHSNGADFVVNKPFRDDELLAAIGRSLRGDAAPAVPPAGPVKADLLERLLRVALKQTVFTLRDGAPMSATTLTPFVLRCLYGQAAQASVVGLLDFPALCVIGATTGSAGAATAIASGRPDPEVVQRATTFMRIASKLIAGHSDTTPFRLLRAEVVSRGTGELDALLARDVPRTDVCLDVQGCGEARIAYLEVAP